MNTYSIHHKGIILEDIPLDSLTAQLQRQGLFVNLPHEVEADAAPDGWMEAVKNLEGELYGYSGSSYWITLICGKLEEHFTLKRRATT